MIHRFFIFNRPVEYKGKNALGIITEGETEEDCIYLCQSRLKDIVCNQEWKDRNSDYTKSWCCRNMAINVVDDTGSSNWSYLSHDGVVYRTEFDDCPIEFVRDYNIEDKGYRYSMILTYIPFVTDFQDEFYVNEVKYYNSLSKMENLEWVDCKEPENEMEYEIDELPFEKLNHKKGKLVLDFDEYTDLHPLNEKKETKKRKEKVDIDKLPVGIDFNSGIGSYLSKEKLHKLLGDDYDYIISGIGKGGVVFIKNSKSFWKTEGDGMVRIG